MARYHAGGYDRLADCRIVACADIVEENATAFAEAHGVDETGVFTDHEAMLADVAPDVVSVCTPPPTHADIVIDCARAGVEAVHCEKPMAGTWGDARAMATECWRRGVQLTFDHQRRFGPAIRHANRLVSEGIVGETTRIEATAPNLFDWGTHVLDAAGFINGDRAADWVLGNVDTSDAEESFGVTQENHALAQWAYANGVEGIIRTGDGSISPHGGLFVRVVGERGTITVPGARARRLPVRTDEGFEERTVPGDPVEDWYELVYEGVEEAMGALRDGRDPGIGAKTALHATEIIFGTYESARRDGRVEFPLTIDDHPLETTLD